MFFLNYLQKRKHVEEEKQKKMESITEHDYCGIENKRSKRLKKHAIPRVSKNIENMTAESLDSLKNIDKNTNRIANAFERLTDFLMNQFSE